jgi:NADH-quinone oxidoreductase subunit J
LPRYLQPGKGVIIITKMSIFYFIAFLSILFAVLVITAKNPVHSVLYLILTFFTITIHYVLLNAQFLAIVNFIVYMGAIMVLFLFVLMLLNLNVASEPVKANIVKFAGVIGGCCLLATLVGGLKLLNPSEHVVLTDTGLGLVKNLGKVLFNQFLLPFEISSILLLSAMVGAVLLAKREKQPDGKFF